MRYKKATPKVDLCFQGGDGKTLLDLPANKCTSDVELPNFAFDLPSHDSLILRSSEASGGPRIVKIVSQDLRSLAPRVEDLVRNVRFSLNDVMDMMLGGLKEPTASFRLAPEATAALHFL